MRKKAASKWPDLVPPFPCTGDARTLYPYGVRVLEVNAMIELPRVGTKATKNKDGACNLPNDYVEATSLSDGRFKENLGWATGVVPRRGGNHKPCADMDDNRHYCPPVGTNEEVLEH